MSEGDAAKLCDKVGGDSGIGKQGVGLGRKIKPILGRDWRACWSNWITLVTACRFARPDNVFDSRELPQRFTRERLGYQVSGTTATTRMTREARAEFYELVQ